MGTCWSQWAANVVDIESMLARVCQNVLGDERVDAPVRRSRALALRELGRIFRATKVRKGKDSNIGSGRDESKGRDRSQI